jgi:16S rRNA (guanine527-N7)-methyltransferase
MSKPRIDAQALSDRLGVSRETLERLKLYESLLRKWQPAINLVSAKTLDDVWGRHFLDSAQLHLLIPKETRVLVDLGSGAGFPGLVLAILGVPEVHLVESDTRKAAFLREVARTTGTAVAIHATRIESLTPFPAGVVTARALAPLVNLLKMAHPFMGPGSAAFFLKGQGASDELTEAGRYWKMQAETYESLTDSSGSILSLRNVHPISGP